MKENKVRTIIENAGIGLINTKDYKIARFSTILGLALSAPLVPIGVIADAVKSVVSVSSLYIDGGKFVKECNDKIRNGKEEVMLDRLRKKLKISKHTRKIDNLVGFLHWLEERDEIVFKDGKIFLNINEEFEVNDKYGQVIEMDFWVNSMELTCLDVAVMYLSEKGDK